MATAKKIKKVEIPIDQRETFVSLQKSFADSEISVEEKLKTLYQLQEADNAIDKIIQLRGELPAEVQALEEELAALHAKEENIKGLIEEFGKSIENNKQNLIEHDEKIAKYQHQLENIANSREYDSINKELENEGLERQIAEKHIGEAKMAIAEKKEDLEDLARRVEIREEDLAAKREELEAIIGSTAEQEAKLQERRDACAKVIDERTMSAYERIRGNAHNHLAVVTLFPKNEDGTYGDACGGCFHTITPQRILDLASGRKLVICEHCGRIIVNPEI